MSEGMKTPPGAPMKCCCPPCAVFFHEGTGVPCCPASRQSTDEHRCAIAPLSRRRPRRAGASRPAASDAGTRCSAILPRTCQCPRARRPPSRWSARRPRRKPPRPDGDFTPQFMTSGRHCPPAPPPPRTPLDHSARSSRSIIVDDQRIDNLNLFIRTMEHDAQQLVARMESARD